MMESGLGVRGMERLTRLVLAGRGAAIGACGVLGGDGPFRRLLPRFCFLAPSDGVNLRVGWLRCTKDRNAELGKMSVATQRKQLPLIPIGSP